MVPVRANWNVAPPAAAVEGVRVASVGTTPVPTVKSTALDTTLPGFFTVTSTEPGVAIRLAGTLPVRWLESVNAVCKLVDVPPTVQTATAPTW